METGRATQKRLGTQLATVLVLMMSVGMVVMALLVLNIQSSFGIMIGAFITISIAFPIALWIFQRMLGPVWQLQSAANTLFMRWGIPLNEQGDLTNLREQLVHLTSFSEERLRALESERGKVGAILDSMMEGVIALDHQGLVILMNPSARRILDLGQESVEGQSLLEVIRNRGLADLVEVCQTLEPKEQCRREVALKLPVHRILEVNAMPLPDSNGIVLVFHDISELRRLEYVRSEFVANVSHELRTPLTAIKGYLETLLDEAPSEPATHRRFLEVAHTHAERLSRLINDLSRLSDIETGKVVLHSQSIDLHEMVNEVLAMLEKDAGENGIILRNEISVGTMVWADRDRLSQIFLNLVDNAMKYTPDEGTVTFKAYEGNHGFMGFQVIDTGQGIPPSDIPRITERFYRVDKARSRNEGGTGLGLAIVKHLVHLHNGLLRIDSELGKGTTVEIELPVEQFTSAS
jgi:two-component system phosphate regulon sensor histidine kinase PhoR